MTSKLGTTLTTVHNLGELKDNKEINEYSDEIVVNTSLCKRYSCFTALKISQTCRDMLGGNGITEEYHIMRHLDNMH